MTVWIYTLTSVTLVSLLSLIGVFTLLVKKELIKKISVILVGFAAGALFGDAFLHLLPEAFEKLGTDSQVPLFVLGGILFFFILEKFLHWRHCHLPESKEHHHPLVTMNLVGDAVHNLIDGLIIGATYRVSLSVGLATTLAIILHEIPQEIGDFGVLIHGGLSAKKALFFNFLSALIAVFGSVFSLLIGSHAENCVILLLPLAAGGFIYIAGSDLIPELKHESDLMSSLKQLAAIVSGVVLMALLTLLE